MKKELFTEFRTIWPIVIHERTRLLSNTISQISFRRRRESESSSSSSLNNIDSTMQHCWSAGQPDICVAKAVSLQSSTLCELCLEPSDSVKITNIFHTTRERQCSEPVRVPDSLANVFLDNQQQSQRSQSSDYESGFSNELSPTSTSWTLGINNASSSPSITSDDLLTDQDQSVFDDNSMTNNTPEEEQASDDDSFEVLSFEAAPENTLYIKEFQYTTSNSQNNLCSCCSTPFTSSHPPRRCHYYGKLYCPRCHTLEQAHIPAKLIKSFDMRLYPVCRRAKYILQLNFHQPLIDILNDNDNLYILVPILTEIKIFRSQFQHFYAYLSTCTRMENDLNEIFFKQFYARDYLYQSVHLYSINDLLSLKKILQTLQRASQHAKDHIYQCPICREKGFTCEICKKRNDVLYPFDETKSIGQCQHCSNIYHKKCWETIEHDCPKCYRLIQRRHEQRK